MGVAEHTVLKPNQITHCVYIVRHNGKIVYVLTVVFMYISIIQLSVLSYRLVSGESSFIYLFHTDVFL